MTLGFTGWTCLGNEREESKCNLWQNQNALADWAGQEQRYYLWSDSHFPRCDKGGILLEIKVYFCLSPACVCWGPLFVSVFLKGWELFYWPLFTRTWCKSAPAVLWWTECTKRPITLVLEWDMVFGRFFVLERYKVVFFWRWYIVMKALVRVGNNAKDKLFNQVF